MNYLPVSGEILRHLEFQEFYKLQKRAKRNDLFYHMRRLKQYPGVARKIPFCFLYTVRKKIFIISIVINYRVKLLIAFL